MTLAATDRPRLEKKALLCGLLACSIGTALAGALVGITASVLLLEYNLSPDKVSDSLQNSQMMGFIFFCIEFFFILVGGYVTARFSRIHMWRNTLWFGVWMMILIVLGAILFSAARSGTYSAMAALMAIPTGLAGAGFYRVFNGSPYASYTVQMPEDAPSQEKIPEETNAALKEPQSTIYIQPQVPPLLSPGYMRPGERKAKFIAMMQTQHNPSTQ